MDAESLAAAAHPARPYAQLHTARLLLLIRKRASLGAVACRFRCLLSLLALWCCFLLLLLLPGLLLLLLLLLSLLLWLLRWLGCRPCCCCCVAACCSLLCILSHRGNQQVLACLQGNEEPGQLLAPCCTSCQPDFRKQTNPLNQACLKLRHISCTQINTNTSLPTWCEPRVADASIEGVMGWR